jgi:hypothetical protein
VVLARLIDRSTIDALDANEVILVLSARGPAFSPAAEKVSRTFMAAVQCKK